MVPSFHEWDSSRTRGQSGKRIPGCTVYYQRASVRGLRCISTMKFALATSALVAAASAQELPCTGNACTFANYVPGNFSVTSTSLVTAEGTNKAGSIATVTINGTLDNSDIEAGTVSWRMYEDGIKNFIPMPSSSSPYFTCTNKGCDRTKPVALALADPLSPNSKFSLSFQFTMVKKQTQLNATASSTMRLYVYGQDQNHNPYDFSGEVVYALED